MANVVNLSSLALALKGLLDQTKNGEIIFENKNDQFSIKWLLNDGDSFYDVVANDIESGLREFLNQWSIQNDSMGWDNTEYLARIRKEHVTTTAKFELSELRCAKDAIGEHYTLMQAGMYGTATEQMQDYMNGKDVLEQGVTCGEVLAHLDQLWKDVEIGNTKVENLRLARDKYMHLWLAVKENWSGSVRHVFSDVASKVQNHTTAVNDNVEPVKLEEEIASVAQKESESLSVTVRDEVLNGNKETHTLHTLASYDFQPHQLQSAYKFYNKVIDFINNEDWLAAAMLAEKYKNKWSPATPVLKALAKLYESHPKPEDTLILLERIASQKLLLEQAFAPIDALSKETDDAKTREWQLKTLTI